MAKEQQLSLWYMRPKIHMMQHVGLLGCNISASRSNHTHGSNSNSDFPLFFLKNWGKSLVPTNLILKRFGHPRLEMSHQMEDPMTEWILNPHSLEPRNLGNWGTSQNQFLAFANLGTYRSQSEPTNFCLAYAAPIEARAAGLMRT